MPQTEMDFPSERMIWQWNPYEDGVSVTGVSLAGDSLTGSSLDGASVNDSEGAEEHLVIPARIEGLPVLKIAEEAFAYGMYSHVQLPPTLKVIEKRAFAFCTGLEEVMLPEELEELDGSAFLFTAIRTLTLPYGLKRLQHPESLDMMLFAAPDHPVFFADGNGLYRRTEGNGLELLSLFLDDHNADGAEYQLHADTVKITAAAFYNIHCPVSLSLPAKLRKIESRAWNPLFAGRTEPLLKHLRIHQDNPVFTADTDGIYETLDDGRALVRWTGGTRAEIPQDIRQLKAWSMTDRFFEQLLLQAACRVEENTFLGSQVCKLCLKHPHGTEEILLPAGRVENNTLLSQIFSSGQADLSPYDALLLSGYLTEERIRMVLSRIDCVFTPSGQQEALRQRLYRDGAGITELLLKTGDVALFDHWLALEEHTQESLLKAMDVLLSGHGTGKDKAGEMMAKLQKRRSTVEEEDEFAL